MTDGSAGGVTDGVPGAVSDGVSGGATDGGGDGAADGGRRRWLHTALLTAPDGTETAAFVIDERAYPDPEAARAAVREAFDALQLRGVAAEFETVPVSAGEPGSPLPSWSEYRLRLDGGGPRTVRPGALLRAELSGELDRDRLNALQDALGMRRSGRLSDDYNSMFGYRVLNEDAGSTASMRLSRRSARAWTVTVSDSGEGVAPSAADVERWRDEVVAAAAGAGLVVGEVSVGA